MLSDDMDRRLALLINRLNYRYQLKKALSPMKARKRILSGVKEVLKAIKSPLENNRPKLVVIAVDVERNPNPNGSDQEVANLVDRCSEQGIPYIFGLTRGELGICLYGKVMHKMKVRCTCIGVIDYVGYEKVIWSHGRKSTKYRKA